MEEPSIKGTIFKGVVDDLIRLRDEGRVSDEELEIQLAAEDLAFLDCAINPAAWYPMESYDRLVRLLGDVEGAGKDAYFVERGRASARRLMAAGLYQQLTFLLRWQESMGRNPTDESVIIATYTSKLKLVVSLTSSIYNVGQWDVEPDPEKPGRVSIAVREATAYSEPMRRAAEGFINECARAARDDLTHLYTSERPAPDLILFRMTRDILGLFPD